MTETTRCRGCGMRIEFHKLKSGKLTPMQRIRSVYVLGEDLLGEPEMQRSTITDGEEPVLISHFEACPNADRFSGRKR